MNARLTAGALGFLTSRNGRHKKEPQARYVLGVVHAGKSVACREVRASYVDIPTGVFVEEVATLVYISPISLACWLNESVCALTNSVWILTTSSKFLAWLSF